eukprot:357517-Hanusia_phi.AAC.1
MMRVLKTAGQTPVSLLAMPEPKTDEGQVDPAIPLMNEVQSSEWRGSAVPVVDRKSVGVLEQYFTNVTDKNEGIDDIVRGLKKKGNVMMEVIEDIADVKKGKFAQDTVVHSDANFKSSNHFLHNIVMIVTRDESPYTLPLLDETKSESARAARAAFNSLQMQQMGRVLASGIVSVPGVESLEGRLA